MFWNWLLRKLILAKIFIWILLIIASEKNFLAST